MWESDDLDPKTQKPKPKNLDPLGVEELTDYIADLKAEITRVEAEIARKKKHLSAAEGLFKN